MISVSWEFVSLGAKEAVKGTLPSSGDPSIPHLMPQTTPPPPSPTSAPLVAPELSPSLVPAPVHPLQSLLPAVRPAAACPPGESGSAGRRCPAQPEGLGRPAGGQEAAPGQQLCLATGLVRPGPGNKHLGAEEGRGLRPDW